MEEREPHSREKSFFLVFVLLCILIPTPVVRGEALRVLQGQLSAVSEIAYAPSGDTIACAGGYGDETVEIWDVNTGELIHRLRGHWDWVEAIAYSPDGRTLASAGGYRSEDRRVCKDSR